MCHDIPLQLCLLQILFGYICLVLCPHVLCCDQNFSIGKFCNEQCSFFCEFRTTSAVVTGNNRLSELG